MSQHRAELIHSKRQSVHRSLFYSGSSGVEPDYNTIIYQDVYRYNFLVNNCINVFRKIIIIYSKVTYVIFKLMILVTDTKIKLMKK